MWENFFPILLTQLILIQLFVNHKHRETCPLDNVPSERKKQTEKDFKMTKNVTCPQYEQAVGRGKVFMGPD